MVQDEANVSTKFEVPAPVCVCGLLVVAALTKVGHPHWAIGGMISVYVLYLAMQYAKHSAGYAHVHGVADSIMMNIRTSAVGLTTVPQRHSWCPVSASQAWSLPDAKSRTIAATRHAVLFGLLGMVVALTTLVISQGADAANYNRWNLPPGYGYNTQANPNYGFGPVQRIQPTDVVSGNKIIGRDPDPFIRGQILREYNSGRN